MVRLTCDRDRDVTEIPQMVSKNSLLGILLRQPLSEYPFWYYVTPQKLSVDGIPESNN